MPPKIIAEPEYGVLSERQPLKTIKSGKEIFTFPKMQKNKDKDIYKRHDPQRSMGVLQMGVMPEQMLLLTSSCEATTEAVYPPVDASQCANVIPSGGVVGRGGTVVDEGMVVCGAAKTWTLSLCVSNSMCDEDEEEEEKEEGVLATFNRLASV